LQTEGHVVLAGSGDRPMPCVLWGRMGERGGGFDGLFLHKEGPKSDSEATRILF